MHYWKRGRVGETLPKIWAVTMWILVIALIIKAIFVGF
jgi:hypothetical protein